MRECARAWCGCLATIHHVVSVWGWRYTFLAIDCMRACVLQRAVCVGAVVSYDAFMSYGRVVTHIVE
jgi:hypothetical protein